MGKINKTVSFTDKDMALFHFAMEQEMQFSLFVKALIQEKADQVAHDSDATAKLMKEILMELAKINRRLDSTTQTLPSITHETFEIEAGYDERDLSGLDDF